MKLQEDEKYFLAVSKSLYCHLCGFRFVDRLITIFVEVILMRSTPF
ncbi:hypothetical protein ACVIJU_003640 [Aeribacillus sp. SP014]